MPAGLDGNPEPVVSAARSRLLEQVADPFARGSGSYRAAIFDEPSDQPLDEPREPVPPTAILLFDGLFLHRPELEACWHLSLFLTAERRREELWRRVEPSRRGRYLDGQALYEREAAPRERADLVIDNDDLVAPKLLVARV